MRTVSEAICLFYRSAQRVGQFGMYDLLDFARQYTDKRITDGTLTRKMRALRAKGLVQYRVVDETRGLYEFMGGEA